MQLDAGDPKLYSAKALRVKMVGLLILHSKNLSRVVKGFYTIFAGFCRLERGEDKWTQGLVAAIVAVIIIG